MGYITDIIRVRFDRICQFAADVNKELIKLICNVFIICNTKTIYMKTFWEFKFVPIIIYDLPNSVPIFFVCD